MWRATAIALMMLGAATARANGQRPVIAVFTIEAKGVELQGETLERLSDYLTTRLAATSAYQVVPRSQLKKRLTGQKKSSYQRCYDQSCQIEIGRELAAQKSLAAQVIKLGSMCMVTATIYDLKQAAADRGATAKGGCDEDQIVGSLEAVVTDLAPKPETAAPPPLPTPTPQLATATPQGPSAISIDFVSEPPGAEIFIDDQAQGMTPLRVDLIPGRSFAVGVEKHGYAPRRERITVEKRAEHSYRLELTPEGRRELMTRTEWVTLEPMFGVAISGDNGGGGGGFLVSVATLKWERLFWTVGEIGGAAGGGGRRATGAFVLGSRLGYPIYFGTRGQHQLRFGLGVGVGPAGDANAPVVIASPTVRYVYQTAGRFFMGVGLRAFLPLHGDFSTSTYDGTNTTTRSDYPAVLMSSFVLGWASRAY